MYDVLYINILFICYGDFRNGFGLGVLRNALDVDGISNPCNGFFRFNDIQYSRDGEIFIIVHTHIYIYINIYIYAVKDYFGYLKFYYCGDYELFHHFNCDSIIDFNVYDQLYRVSVIAMYRNTEQRKIHNLTPANG